MSYEHLLETAEWLGKETDAAKLIRLKELSEHKFFCVTVWGHYSAGKSKLINNLLERVILPVQSRETTAALTYIRYGEEEGCTFIYEDGTARSYQVDALKSAFQNTTQFDNMEKIDHIEVSIKDSLLQSGLVLVDTPGVNTIIQKHQDLAVDAIEQSGRILYVLGNSPTNVDRDFIKQIVSCGVEIDFVRTKCDRFIGTEEDGNTSLEKEKKSLESFVGKEIEFFQPVSNEKNSKWFSNIDLIRTQLNDIAYNISEEMDEAQKKREAVFLESYIQELQEEKKRLKDIIDGRLDSIKNEIEKYEMELQSLESKSATIEERIEKEVEEAKKESERELDEIITRRIKNFKAEIKTINPKDDIEGEAKKIYSRHMGETIEIIHNVLNACFETIVKDEIGGLRNCIQEDNIDLPIPVYAEIRQENSRTLELYKSRLMEEKQYIEKILEDQERLRAEIETYEEDGVESICQERIEELNNELAEIPTTPTMKVVESQKLQPSSVFRMVGEAADMALLLLPGNMVASGIKTVANTTKIAQTLHKMGPVGKIIVEAGSTVSQHAGVIDRARDIAYTVNEALHRRPKSTRKEKEAAKELVDKTTKTAVETHEKFKKNKRNGNVLDALSVAYWTEKFGKMFDSQPQMVIDVEENNLRLQRRREIIEEQQRLSAERLNNKRKLGLLEDKKRELEEIAREEERKKKAIESELENERLQIRDQAQKKVWDRFCEDYVRYYGENVVQASRSISEQYFQSANQNLTMYTASQTKRVKKDIDVKKAQLENLLMLRDKGDSEIEIRMNECSDLLKKLEMDEQCAS